MIIDAHTHMPSPGWPGHDSPFESVSAAVDYMKDANTNTALFTPWQGVMAETEKDLDEANAASLALAEEFKGFLYPGASIHPAFPETSRRWIKEFRELGYKWVGELVFYKKRYSYLDDAFIELCRDFAEYGHILQLHCHEDIIELARRFPDIQIVCAHIDINICRQLAELPNTWVDISGKQGGLFIGALEGAYQAMGADRLLYGTDFTIYDPRAFQARVSAVLKDKEDREKIFWKNAVRLLDSAGSRPIGVR